MVFAAAVNRGLGSRTGAGRVSRELPTEPGPPRALKPPFSRSREKGRFHHGLLGAVSLERQLLAFCVGWLSFRGLLERHVFSGKVYRLAGEQIGNGEQF